MEEPRCRACGCAYGSHGEDGACRTRKVTDWDEQRRAFLTETSCGCPGYDGLIPVPVSNDCSHEFLTKLDPTRCVHCKKFVPLSEQRKEAAQ